MEVSVRSAHNDLVAGFKRKNVRRSDARHHVLEAYGRFGLERRRRYADGQHDAVAFCRVVRHGVGADGLFRVLAFQVEETEFLPCREVFFTDQRLVNVFVVVHGECWYLDLCVRSGDEVHVFAFWQFDNELFDKRSYVLVGDDFAFPFFDAEHRVRNSN